jgi:uncharacterized protein (DUF2147 family)
MQKLFLFCFFLSFAAAAYAGADGILGEWYNQEKDATVLVYKCDGGKYCGKINWMKEPDYPAGDVRAGSPRLDDKNPDPALRARPVLGLDIFTTAFSYAGADTWSGGRLYDPRSGKSYRGRMRLISPDKLKLRGYVLFSLFGRSSTWTRAR